MQDAGSTLCVGRDWKRHVRTSLYDNEDEGIILQYPCWMLTQEVGPCQDHGAVGNCKNPIPFFWNNFCSFRQDVGRGWAAYMICDEARQQNIVKYIR